MANSRIRLRLPKGARESSGSATVFSRFHLAGVCCQAWGLANTGIPPSPSLSKILHINIEDVAVTRAIAEAGKLLDIDLVDHLICGHGRFVSLKERGLGF